MKKYSGFTLMELMVAIAVLGIVLAAGLPQLSIFFKGNRMVTNANGLLAGLHIARSEAIKRNSRVSICKSKNADSASPTCGKAGVDWDDGWFVFVEGTDVGNVYGEYTATDGPILRVNAGAEGDLVTIKGSHALNNYVTFTSRGAPKQRNGASQSGVFRVCDDRGLTNAAGGVVARGVMLNSSGRVRNTRDATKIGACP